MASAADQTWQYHLDFKTMNVFRSINLLEKLLCCVVSFHSYSASCILHCCAILHCMCWAVPWDNFCVKAGIFLIAHHSRFICSISVYNKEVLLYIRWPPLPRSANDKKEDSSRWKIIRRNLGRGSAWNLLQTAATYSSQCMFLFLQRRKNDGWFFPFFFSRANARFFTV